MIVFFRYILFSGALLVGGCMLPSPNYIIHQHGLEKFSLSVPATLYAKTNLYNISHAVCSQREVVEGESERINRESYTVVGSVLVPIPMSRVELNFECSGGYDSFYRYVTPMESLTGETGKALVLIYNSSGFLYYNKGAGHVHLAIDGLEMGEVPVGRYIELLVEPGQYRFDLARKDMFWFKDTVDVEVVEGVNVYNVEATSFGSSIVAVDNPIQEIKNEYKHVIQVPEIKTER